MNFNERSNIIDTGQATVQREGKAHPLHSAMKGFHQCKVLPGIDLVTMEMDCGEGTRIDFSKPENIFEFGFVLSGNARSCSPDTTKHGNFEVKPDSVVVHYLPNINLRFEIHGHEPTRMLGINIDTNRLRDMMDDDGYHVSEMESALKGNGTHFVNVASRMTALQKMVANQIMDCQFTGSARKFFIQAKALELLSYQLDTLGRQKSNGRKAPLAKSDVERIREARTILRTSMASPPSLADLAAMVGVNTNKLKTGFRAVFNQTAFGCLHEDRMHRAQALLQERQLNVSEVAWEIGYSNVGHFSVAFRKFFGVRPKDFRADSGRRFHSIS